MHIQINSDNRLNLGAESLETIESRLADRLSRFSDRLTRLEVHCADINGPSNVGPDKQCRIEARPNGLQPLTVDATAETIDAAVSDAASKLITALERTFGKLTNRKGH